MPAGEVTVRLNLNKDGYSASMSAARREAAQLEKSLKDVGHNVPSEMQAASASIRLIEGDLQRNVRAVERFITTIPGIGKALQFAFPAVGAIALVGIIAKIGEEAVAAYEKVQKSGQAIDNSFRSLNLSAQTANDTLRVTNDRLENEIAKLQGKPQNNLAIAIDEARVAADKMAESLDRDNQKIRELLSQNAVPAWAAIFGKAGTGTLSDTINGQNQNLSNLAAQANVLQHQGDIAGADRVRASIDSTRQAYLAKNAKDIADRQQDQNKVGGLGQGANVAIDYGQQASLYNQIDQQNELKRNVAKQALEDQKAQQEAAKRAAEAMKQAQEMIVRQWQQALEQDKANATISTDQEAVYWDYRAMTAKKGSLSYITALNEANKDIAKINADSMRLQKETATKSDKFDDTAGNVGVDRFDLSRSDSGDLKSNGNATVQWLKNLNEGIQLQHQNADAFAEASVAMALATGQMSKLDAAQVMGALHAQQYKEAVDALNAALANAQSLPAGTERNQRIAGLNNQGTQMAGQRQIQSISDQQAVVSQQLGPAMQQALGQMVNDWENMTKSIVSIMSRTIDSLNDDIVKAMTGKGKASDFGKTFEQAGSGLLKTGLQGIEGAGLSWLTHGKIGGKKADGSQASPFYVVMAGAGGSASPGSSIPGVTGTAMSGIAGSPSVWKGIGGWLGGLFQGAHAGGGDVVSGRAALVGERGPELFVPGSAGSIIPNHQLGGSGGDTHFHIDARGSNDPAAVHAAVMRAAPSIMAGSMQAQHSMSKRTPHGR